MVINGVSSSAVSYDKSRRSLKITNMNYSYTEGITTDGMSICFTLDENSPCPNLTTLCSGK